MLGNADSKETNKNIQLQIHMCDILHNRERLQMKYTTKKIWKVVDNLYETFEDFIWKEQRSRKNFSDFTSIPKNDSIELQRQIENLEEKKKELENKLLKKESDYNRLSVNYAKLFNRKKNIEMNPDKLKNEIDILKKENKNLKNELLKYKEEKNIFGISFIEDDLESS